MGAAFAGYFFDCPERAVMNRTGRSLTQTKLRVRSLLFPRQVEKELHEELQNHFVFQVAQNLEAGLSEEEARREALRSLEGVDRVKERCRDMQGLNWMRDLYRDLRYAFRAFGHNLGFTITAVAILGLGIGSTTAVFSAVDRLLFQSMPYSSPKELVSLGFTLPFMNYPFLFANLYLDWQRQARPFASLGAWSGILLRKRMVRTALRSLSFQTVYGEVALEGTRTW